MHALGHRMLDSIAAMTWVVLGGSGVLGRAVVGAARHHTVIAASRHVAGPGRGAGGLTTRAGAAPGVAGAAGGGAPAGRLPDIGGPEQLPIAELARMWKRAAGKRRLVVPIPVPGARGKFLRSGAMCCADRRGRTFVAWLADRYASPPPSPPMLP